MYLSVFLNLPFFVALVFLQFMHTLVLVRPWLLVSNKKKKKFVGIQDILSWRANDLRRRQESGGSQYFHEIKNNYLIKTNNTFVVFKVKMNYKLDIYNLKCQLL